MKDEHYLRFFSAGVLMSLLPLAILLRLVLLQVVPSLRLPYLDNLNTLKYTTSKIVPTRGTIVDRKGNTFATNQRTYEVGISPEQVKDAAAVQDTLQDALGEININVASEVATALENKIRYIVVIALFEDLLSFPDNVFGKDEYLSGFPVQEIIKRVTGSVFHRLLELIEIYL